MSSPSIQSGRNLRTQQQQQQEVLSDPSKYLVKNGDNLSKIAQQHGVDLQSLIAANPQIKNPDLIFPNQSINIPQAQAAEGHTPAEGATTGGHGVMPERETMVTTRAKIPSEANTLQATSTAAARAMSAAGPAFTGRSSGVTGLRNGERSTSRAILSITRTALSG